MAGKKSVQLEEARNKYKKLNIEAVREIKEQRNIQSNNYFEFSNTKEMYLARIKKKTIVELKQGTLI